MVIALTNTENTNPPKFGKSARYRAWPDGFVFFHEPSLPVSDLQRKEIAKCLGVEPESEHVEAVVVAIRRFASFKEAMSSLPDGDHRNRDRRALKALVQAMDGLSPNVMGLLAQNGVTLTLPDGPDQIAAAARSAIDGVDRNSAKKGKGNRADHFKNELFRELAGIYSNATGRALTYTNKPDPAHEATGPLVDFLCAAVSPVPELKRMTTGALAKACARAHAKDK